MITYVNSKEAKLFEEAAIELGETSLSVEDYIKSLGTLKTKSPKYVRLPLYEDGHEDEEIFEIDANARTIKIPASFRKNGVGVVSDELAETVWFKINRFFDIKDFGEAAGKENSGKLKDGDLHILIQWEAPDQTKGASWAIFVDKDTDPEYIYFGWALTAEHLTAKPGNIRFAVRIMQYDLAGNISYSFATQAAAVAVKANLSFDLTDEDVILETVADKFVSRLMDGPIAYCPVFKPGESADDVGGNLPLYIDNLEGDPAVAELKVDAAAPAGSSYDAIAYKWYHKGLDADDFELIDPNAEGYEGQFTPTLTVTSSGSYYVMVYGMREIVDNNEFIYYPAQGEEGEEDYVPAHISDPEAEKFRYHTSVASSQSNICVIPSPEPLKVDEIDNYLIITAEAYNIVLIVERQKIGPEDNKRTVGQVEIKAYKTADAVKVEGEIPENAFQDVPVLANAEVEGPGIYYEIDPEDTIIIHMNKAEEGYYKFDVINKLNGNSKTTTTGICRVAKPAAFVAGSALASAIDENGDAVIGEPSVSDRHMVIAAVQVDGLSDSLEIEWFEQKGQQDPAGSNDAADESVDKGLFEEHKIYVPKSAGYVYFIATNNVEDSKATIKSASVKFAG